MKKVILTIIFSVVMVGLSIPIVVLDGDATAFALFLMFGICAVYSAIYDMKKENKTKTSRISCETCLHYNTDRNDQPCCSCWEYVNWEKGDSEQ